MNDISWQAFIEKNKRSRSVEKFSADRWPYTYACDYVRTHPENIPDRVKQQYNDFVANHTYSDEFSPINNMSRADTSTLIGIWEGMLIGELGDDPKLTIQFARAYCEERNIEIPFDAEIRPGDEQ